MTCTVQEMAAVEKRVVAKLERAIETALVECEAINDPLIRAATAKVLAEVGRTSQYKFGSVRTNTMVELRDEGWSLADLKEEFGMSRARASALINREERRNKD